MDLSGLSVRRDLDGKFLSATLFERKYFGQYTLRRPLPAEWIPVSRHKAADCDERRSEYE